MLRSRVMAIYRFAYLECHCSLFRLLWLDNYNLAIILSIVSSALNAIAIGSCKSEKRASIIKF